MNSNKGKGMKVILYLLTILFSGGAIFSFIKWFGLNKETNSLGFIDLAATSIKDAYSLLMDRDLWFKLTIGSLAAALILILILIILRYRSRHRTAA